MQYLIIKHTGKKWVGDTIITVNYGSGQKGAISNYLKQNKDASGEFWLFPVNHSNFYTFKKGKVIKKARFYKS